MAKGFIRGTIWGAGISVSALTIMSIVSSDLAQRDITSASRTVSTQRLETPGANRGKEGLGPSAAGLATTEVPAPEPDTLAALVADALAPAAVPLTGGASILTQTAPLSDTAMDGVASTTGQAPSVRYAGSTSLSTPATEPVLSISTDPAQPVAPEVVAQATAFAEVADADPQVEKEEAPVAQAPVASGIEIVALDMDPAQPMSPLDPAPSSAFDITAPLPGLSDIDVVVDLGAATEGQETVTAALKPDTGLISPPSPGPQIAQSTDQPAAAPLTEDYAASVTVVREPAAPETTVAFSTLKEPDAQEALGDKQDSSNAQVSAEIAVVVPTVSETQDRQAEAPVLMASAPRIAAAATALPNVTLPDSEVPSEIQTSAEPSAPDVTEAPATEPVREAEVKINRLPSLGTSTTEPAPAVATAPLTAPSSTTDAGPPLQRFSADFDAPAEKPLMAVVLIDEGADLTDAVVGIDAIKALPYPVSFAVNALLPDAAERMATYRAAGFEVLVALDLPDGASAADAEVNVSFALNKLPEVIGILEGPGTGVQTTPMAGRQVASILAQTGHGFVTQNRGLNTVQKLAVREGVPARAVFRDLDSKDQSEVVIRRFMDQAAFRSGQDDGVVMLGRLRQDTLAALLSWSLQDRASTVAMAPVSALLLKPE